MKVNKENYEYCIEVERGKYHVVLTKDYQVKFLRFGDDWVNNPPGSKMMIALMAETERKEQEIERLREALKGAQEELITIRGVNKTHDGEITGLCIKIRKVLDGDEWE